MSMFGNLDGLLSKINQDRLRYELRKLELQSESPEVQEFSRHNNEYLIEELSKRVEEEFNKLFMHDEDAVSICPGPIMDIITLTNEAADAGLLEFSSKEIDRLQKQIVGYQQEVLMQRLKSYISPLSNACRNMQASPEAGQAFPHLDQEYIDENKKHADHLKGMLEKDDPDKLHDCLNMIDDVLFTLSDLTTGTKMLKMVEEKVFEWCLTPSNGVIGDEQSLDGFDPDKRNYMRLLLQLDEMHSRFSAVQKKWKGVLAWVFGNDYARPLEGSLDALEDVRGKIGSEGLISRVHEGKIDISNILKQTAFLGPMHLDMAVEYMDILSKEIQNNVFGKDMRIEEYSKPKDHIFMEEREFVVCSQYQLRRYGFSDDEQERLGEPAYGIITTYTIIPKPLKKYPENWQLSKDVEHYRSRLFIGEKIKCIDFYEDENAVPEEILKEFNNGMPLNDPEFIKMVEDAETPSGSYQVSMPCHFIFLKDFYYTSEKNKKKRIGNDHFPIYKRCTTSDDDRGMHDNVNALRDKSPGNSTMTKERLISMLEQSR